MNEHLNFWIDAYLDGEIAGGLLEQVEAHLHSCEDCQQLLESRKKLSVLLQSMPSVEVVKPETQFLADVNALISNHRSSKRTLPPQIRDWIAGRFQFLAWSSVSLIIVFVNIFLRTVGLLEGFLSLFPGDHQTLLNQLTMAPSVPQVFAPEPLRTIVGQIGWFGLLDWNWIEGLVVSVVLSILYVAWLTWWLVRNWSSLDLDLKKINSRKV